MQSQWFKLRIRSLLLSKRGPCCRAVITLVVTAFLLAVHTGEAHADERCRSGATATYQLGESIVEYGARAAEGEIDSEMRKYVPSARSIDLTRSEHMLQLGYDHQLRPYAVLRLYGGFSLSPESVVYQTSGPGYYPVDGEPTYIGTIHGRVKTSGQVYLAGADVLFLAGGCSGGRLHLAGAVGLATVAYRGRVHGEFDAEITAQSPDLVLTGRYYGFGVHSNLLGGFRLDLTDKVDLTVLGGARLGVGYISFQSDIKDKDGVMPIVGPVFQLTLGYRF